MIGTIPSNIVSAAHILTAEYNRALEEKPLVPVALLKAHRVFMASTDSLLSPVLVLEAVAGHSVTKEAQQIAVFLEERFNKAQLGSVLYYAGDKTCYTNRKPFEYWEAVQIVDENKMSYLLRGKRDTLNPDIRSKDYSDFSVSKKTLLENKVNKNYRSSAIQLYFWNDALEVDFKHRNQRDMSEAIGRLSASDFHRVARYMYTHKLSNINPDEVS